MELVKIENKQVVTSSLEISKSFGKQHYHVIRDIENIQKDISNFGEMFYKGKYKDSYNRNQKYYLINRDGFTLLVMGFNGKQALEWKIKYINAFNKMEKQIQKIVESRIRSIGIRNSLTDSIKQLIPESHIKSLLILHLQI